MTLRALLVALVMATGAAAATETKEIGLPGPVDRIVDSGSGVFAATKGGSWFRIEQCATGALCARPSAAPAERPAAPPGALPDGTTASAGTGDIRRAWYGRPTGRYRHGVLGDAVEAGSLVAEDASGRRYEHVLAHTHVFEDLTPRIADLDGDGRNEIVAIRSSLTRGAALAVFGLSGGRLELIDATPEIGRPNRWLNVAGIGDYLGDGRRLLAWVETPHIGGTLKMAALAAGRLERAGPDMPGFSNHVIGSRELAMSATADLTGDGVDDLVLPSADRKALVLVAAGEAVSVPLPSRVAQAVAVVSARLVTATEDGRLMAIVP
jgi:hypothetical protein